ncbi:hypothetical protein C9I84_099 [Candidatus Vidania fulgoroideae]|uniref:Uncharacterized protein n=1 Tax=Candidatus Vidania fulgoroideorum TaxID=881286 RepID=A0A346E0I6_9PROT|nr:hypothetical protein C9I84_099 [Candidatus Vidania fulgoroideae]
MKLSYSNLQNFVLPKNFKIFREVLEIEGIENNIKKDIFHIKLLYNIKKLYFFKSIFENLKYNILNKIENHFILKKRENVKNIKKYVLIIKKIWSNVLINSFILKLKIKYGIHISKIYFENFILFYIKKISNTKYFNLLYKEIYLYLNKISVINFNTIFFFKKKKNILIKISIIKDNLFNNILNKLSLLYKSFDNKKILISIDKRIFFLLKQNSFKFEKTFLEINNKITCLNYYLNKRVKFCKTESNLVNKIIFKLTKEKYKMLTTSSFTSFKKKKSIEILNPEKDRFLRTNIRDNLIKKHHKEKKFFEIGNVFKKKKYILQTKNICIVNNILKTNINSFTNSISFLLNFFNKLYFKNKLILFKKKNIYGLIGKYIFLNKTFIFFEIELNNFLYKNIFNEEKYFYKKKNEKYFIIKIKNKKINKLIKFRKNFFLVKNHKKNKTTFFLLKTSVYYKNLNDLKKKKNDSKIKKILKLSC